MSYEIKPASVFGRLGSTIGQSLSEQVPKEVERQRLASGLNKLSQQQGLTPFQQFAQLSSLPGVTPQMIESGSQLLRQQGIAQELKNKATQNPYAEAFKRQQEIGNQKGQGTLTSTQPIEATLKNYIPMTPEQLQARAGQLLSENPALYANDPQKAYQQAVQENEANIARNAAFQQRRVNEQAVEQNIRDQLGEQAGRLNAKLPGDIYSQIENKAIEAIKPIEEGGEGLTEKQARDKYGKELDQISREYQSVNNIGNWGILGRSQKETLNKFRTVRDEFKNRNDLRNFADQLTANNGISPQKAYYLAYPVSDEPALEKIIKKLPNKNKQESHNPQKQMKIEKNRQNLFEDLASNLGKGSPLSIAQELELRGFDRNLWLEFLNKNKDRYELNPRQRDELAKPGLSFIPPMNDAWLLLGLGLDDIVEK